MSLSFRPIEKVDAAELFDGRLEKFGVREHFNRETSKEQKWLTDGHSYLKVYIDDDGTVQDFIRWMSNGDPTNILIAIEDCFDTAIASELEPQYYGFDTEEEWHAAEMAFREQLRQGLVNTEPVPHDTVDPDDDWVPPF